MQIAYLCIILCFQVVAARSSRELDSLLQEYAFEALIRPRTGAVYDAKVPSNFSGIGVAALRLRSGSLRRRGVVRYKEFRIPVDVVEQPYVERLVLVYHNLANWSGLYYPLPGYNFLTPVLGLLAYDATDLSAKNLSELDFRANGEPISIGFSNVRSGLKGSLPKCVSFGLDGSVGFDNVVNGNTCLTRNQGHFSIVVESLVSPPAPAPAVGGGGKRRKRKLWIIVGSVVGGLIALVFLSMLFFCVRKCKRRKEIRRMERAADTGVNLPMTTVGTTKAPVASETRTRPMLENEFVP